MGVLRENQLCKFLGSTVALTQHSNLGIIVPAYVSSHSNARPLTGIRFTIKLVKLLWLSIIWFLYFLQLPILSNTFCWSDGIIQNGSLQWCHNGCDGVWNHQHHDCLLNRLFKAQIEEDIKALRHWPLCREFTGDWWIPHTNGQWRRKCCHLMTSSCV